VAAGNVGQCQPFDPVEHFLTIWTETKRWRKYSVGHCTGTVCCCLLVYCGFVAVQLVRWQEMGSWWCEDWQSRIYCWL